MRAMVFVDRSGAALAPLDRQYTTALLPVVDKPLVQYRLEELIEAGITDCLFVISGHAEKLEAFLGRGERWGARFRFALSRGGEAPSAVSRRVDIGDDEPLLVLRADLMASPSVGRFLESAAGIHGDQVLGAAEDPRASLVLLRSGHGDAGELLDQLHWTPDGGSDATLPQVASVDLSSVMVNPIASLADYHRANLDLVAKRIPGVTPGGRELALGLTAGRRAIASPKSLKQGQAYVGENSRVSPEAELLGEVVICRDVVVDRAATISDSVILPYSYIGELVEVTNAIIAHDILIRVDTGAVIKIADAFLLGRIGDDSGAPPGPRLWHRLVGGLLLLLSLPLWPLALIAALLLCQFAKADFLIEKQ
jgi:mannose-1-phosphate guanylyltransferase/phosphomannomutase